jgi:hypothetical protein
MKIMMRVGESGIEVSENGQSRVKEKLPEFQRNTPKMPPFMSFTTPSNNPNFFSAIRFFAVFILSIRKNLALF